MNFSRVFTKNRRISIIGMVFFVGLALSNCSEKVQKKLRVDPAFSNYVTGYTSGVINKDRTIQIQLTEDYKGEIDYDHPIKENLFTFSPQVEGQAYWLSRNIIEFRPTSNFQSGADYEVYFDVGKLVTTDNEFEQFAFNFKTVKQGAMLYIDGLITPDHSDFKTQELQGRLVMADVEDTSLLKKTLSAFQDGKELPLQWSHHETTTHRFTVLGIERKSEQSEVKLVWNGTLFGVMENVTEKVKVSALGDFKITDMEVIQEPEQYVRVHFSDPLLANQNLEGLITINGAKNMTYLIEGHIINVYYQKRLTGDREVTVSSGVRNIANVKMKSSSSYELVFEGLKPAVKLTGNGVIAPHTPEGVLFPFEAVNLQAIDITITKIYEDNILQFLQVNSFHGDYQMKRVSKQVFEKRVLLNPDGDLNLHTWNKFNIDLSDIVKQEEGAIYSIEIRFKKDYSVYSCGGKEPALTAENTYKEETEWTENNWSSYDYWYDYEYWDYSEGYDYKERKNPCHTSYYRGKSVRANILASDIGIVAKAGGDKTMHVFLNDLLTTDPLAGSTVEFYDFQQKLLGSVKTDANGMCQMKLDEKPFLVIAKHNKQRGYLKLRDGESLSMSKFEVGGSTVQKGVKGFIYTERGVWRPGDSIYMAFMLEDKNEVIPNNHPVTFELYNPQNQLVDKKTLTTNLHGLYDFRTATSSEDLTGNYFANIKIGNRKFSKVLKVETVKPNRLKVYLDFGKEKLSKLDKSNKGKLSVKWLHGAIAKNLKAKIDLTVNSKRTTFEKFKKYAFDNPIKSFKVEDQVIFESQVDENGEAVFEPEIYVGDNAPGMLRAHFVTKVFEKGGGFSIDRSSIDYSPYASYVGVKVPEGSLYRGTLVTDKDHEIGIATVDANGTQLSLKNVDVKVYKISWKWWWDAYDNNLASYIAKSSTTPIYSDKINTSGGRGQFTLRVNRPEWGRYLVVATDPNSGHSAGKIIYIDWPYEYRTERTAIENATMLNFSTDKEVYSTGEPVKISFPSSGNGKAIITVETGTKVLEKHMIETQQGETKFEILTTPEMSPNAFLHITLLQPHANTLNDAPIRMYGVAPILIEDPKTHLKPVITMPDVIRPESTINVAINETEGKAMTYTLAIVDEGLLDLTSFKTPSPWDHFYAKEALGVRTWDMYDEVMGAFNTELSKMLAIGGDKAVEVKKPNKANRFEPMVRYIGPFHLPADGKNNHKVEVPNYVGSVRVMVVAGQDAKYGKAEKTVPVRSPLMVLGTLPRVLSPTEEVYLPVNVFAMEEKIKNVTIEVEANDLLQLVGEGKQFMTFSKIGDEVINFKLKVKKKIGIAKVKVIAKSGGETARYEIELDIRTPNPMVAEVKEKAIQPGESWSPDFAFTGIEGTNSATVELTAFPSVNLDQRLKYLINYPHGCIEQTTSAVFPQLALDQIMGLNNDFKIAIDKNIKSGLERLRLFQIHSGGFAYWPGNTDASEWGTNYAGHFMLEAENKGFKLPAGLKNGWLKYQKNRADKYKIPKTDNPNFHYRQHTQAYRLYTLALAKSPDLGAMNRLREYTYLSQAAKWRLAAAYQLAGQTEIAKQMIFNTSTTIPEYTELSYTYGSNIRDEAMILEALILMNDQQAGGLAKKIAEKLNERRYMSTQTTAYSLLAIGKYLGKNKTSKTMHFAFNVNGKEVANKTTQIPIFKETVNTSSNKNSISVSNNGDGLLYARLVVEGVPVIGDETSMANNVKMYISYKDMDGEEISPDRIEQGTDFLAEVTVTNPGTRGYLKEMTLNQLFPSGWEIHNTRMDEFTSTVKTGNFDYQDIRDDRVYTYYRIAKGASKVFTIKLNATYLGKFYLPTVVTEAMYDESITARKGGRWIEVIEPNAN